MNGQHRIIAANDPASRTRAIVAEQLGVEPREVEDPNVRLCPESGLAKLTGGGGANLGGDSLDVVELVMRCEDDFRIEISDDETERVTDGTVGDLVHLIVGKLESRAA